MKILLLILSLCCTLQLHGAESAKKWKLALKRAMVDEWQPLFGIDALRPARPAETWAQKMVVVQELIVKSTGVHVPIFLSPELASTELPAIEQQEGLGVPIRHVAVGEVIRFLANTGGLRMTETDSGILLELTRANAK